MTEVSGESSRVERGVYRKSSRNPPKGHLTSDIVQATAQDCDPGEKEK